MRKIYNKGTHSLSRQLRIDMSILYVRVAMAAQRSKPSQPPWLAPYVLYR